MKLSEAIEYTQRRLSPSCSFGAEGFPKKVAYTCDGLGLAYSRGKPCSFDRDFPELAIFFTAFGVNCGSRSEFEEFPPGPERQGARFLWLEFARLVLLDEGL